MSYHMLKYHVVGKRKGVAAKWRKENGDERRKTAHDVSLNNKCILHENPAYLK